jgi:hypothetical protein
MATPTYHNDIGVSSIFMPLEEAMPNVVKKPQGEGKAADSGVDAGTWRE